MRSRRAAALVGLALGIGAAVAVGAAGLAGPDSSRARTSHGASRTTEATRDDARSAASRERTRASAKARRLSVSCTRYAAPGGRDRNRGTKRNPFRTAQRLADSLRAGQTGCLRGGLYDQVQDGYVLRVGRGGAPGEAVTIRGYPGERARLKGIVTVPAGSNHVRLSYIGIRGTGRANTVKIYARRVVVQNSNISNRGRGESCMILGSTSGYGRARGVIVRRNRFHDCGDPGNDNKDHAVYVSNSLNARIVGNVFWRTAAYAVHLYPNARGTRVAHNVIDGGRPSNRGGILFGGDSEFASSGNVVEQNVVAYARTSNITSNWDGLVGRRNVARRNCLWGARDGNIDSSNGGFRRGDNRVARPRFVDRWERDYRLRPASRCRSVVGYDAAALLP